MTSSNRSAQLAKLHKVLKKIYHPVSPQSQRPVLEHLLFACCLENATYVKAEEALGALVHTFFDWNEIRVTTIKELAELMSVLPDPAAAAGRVRRVLQQVFESSYCFDLEELRKKTLGQAVERLQKMGATRFGAGYVVQSALGGHAIPLDQGTLEALHVLDMISDEELQSQEVSGLERAIAKNKGIEFSSLLHQLGADFAANRYSTNLHKTLLQINPAAEGRLPKRRKVEPAVAGDGQKPPAQAEGAKEAEKSAGARADAKGAETKEGRRKKKDGVEARPMAAPAKAKEGKSATAKKKPAKKGGPPPRPVPGAEKGKKSAALGLSKRKPR